MLDLNYEMKILDEDTKRLRFLSDIKLAINIKINEKYSHYKFASDKIIKNLYLFVMIVMFMAVKNNSI